MEVDATLFWQIICKPGNHSVKMSQASPINPRTTALIENMQSASIFKRVKMGKECFVSS